MKILYNKAMKYSMYNYMGRWLKIDYLPCLDNIGIMSRKKVIFLRFIFVDWTYIYFWLKILTNK